MSEKLQDRGRKMAETMAVVSYKVLPKCNALYSVSVNVTTRKAEYSNTSKIKFRLATLIIWMCVVSVLVTTADARVYVLRSKNSSNRPCKVHKNQPLHAIMDRVCVICHEMFSHERPNMRAECRSNCFRSEHFRKCLNMFRPNEETEVLFEDSRR
uniref:Secreted protein n=3 Tax=Parascaris TaxID=6254 RepID=A0A915AGG5_PARUN